ncbi:hypothetical protein Pan189_32720 [Stratiformator vulcanicus]|uniref:Uncharacterized protein n=1 Tax=Stratiformator vulcanicus TaxID=2527980 RepID=A0A517R4X8_9PLAN|nr:hypothetical protein Pan189_32720 [Stratiformator vulcanicus]
MRAKAPKARAPKTSARLIEQRRVQFIRHRNNAFPIFAKAFLLRGPTLVFSVPKSIAYDAGLAEVSTASSCGSSGAPHMPHVDSSARFLSPHDGQS